jgi:methylase of polypeptide subunit release factors
VALADVNREAVAAARATIEYNGLQERASVFQSDVLKGVPSTERWDLVVGNPPHFLQLEPGDDDIRVVDSGWEIHRDFYRTVGQFLKPGAKVVMMENAGGSSPEEFEPMILEGGGTLETVLPGTNVFGTNNGLYYLVSRW